MPYTGRHRAARSVPRRPRRKFIWSTLSSVATTTTAGSTTVINVLGDLESAVGANLVGCTITRVRGHITFQALSAAPLLEATWGLVVVPASMVTTTELNPQVHPYLNWHILDQSAQPAAVSSGDLNHDWPVGLLHREIDLRSKRKLENVEDQYTLAVNAATGTGPANWSIYLRTLVQLP